MMNLIHCTAILLLLAVAPQQSLQQGDATLVITPQSAVRGTPIEFECSTAAADLSTFTNVAVSYFFLTRTKNGIVDDVVKYDQRCSPLSVKQQTLEKEFQSATITPTSCYSLKVSGVSASDQTAAEYRCSFHLITTDYSKTSLNSQYTALTVGDEAPEVSLLDVKRTSDMNPLPENGEINAGTNLTITCGANTVQPVPKYTITAGEQILLTKTPAVEDNGRVVVTYLVPKLTSVTVKCSLHNGFGTEKFKETAVIPVYGASHSAIVIPENIVQQYTTDIEVCSLANNPAKPLSVTVQDSAKLMQDGYPRYEAKDGVSRAFIKLKDNSAGGDTSAKELSITCGLDGGAETPVSKTVAISGVEASTQAPNSAMMTIGIVIAIVVGIIVLVSIVAIALKRRSNSRKDGNSDKHYDKVGQNDANAYIENAAVLK